MTEELKQQQQHSEVVYEQTSFEWDVVLSSANQRAYNNNRAVERVEKIFGDVLRAEETFSKHLKLDKRSLDDLLESIRDARAQCVDDSFDDNDEYRYRYIYTKLDYAEDRIEWLKQKMEIIKNLVMG